MTRSARNGALAGLALAATVALSGCQSSSDYVADLEACDDAMASAAGIADLNNDAALLETVSVCQSASAWVSALKRHPGAGALTSYTDQDAWAFLSLVCADAMASPTCRDAESSGILD